MADWVVIPFDSGGIENPSSGLIPFDVNWDMDYRCFIPREAFAVIDVDITVPVKFSIAVGSVSPDNFNTQSFIARGEFVSQTNDFIVDLKSFRTCYHAKGYSGWLVTASANFTGTLYLYGELVTASELVMAQVTFDYSSLIEVGSESTVAARRASLSKG